MISHVHRLKRPHRCWLVTSWPFSRPADAIPHCPLCRRMRNSVGRGGLADAISCISVLRGSCVFPVVWRHYLTCGCLRPGGSASSLLAFFSEGRSCPCAGSDVVSTNFETPKSARKRYSLISWKNKIQPKIKSKKRSNGNARSRKDQKKNQNKINLITKLIKLLSKYVKRSK